MLALTDGWQPLLLMTHNGSLETVQILSAAQDKQQLLSRPSRYISFAENTRPVGSWKRDVSRMWMQFPAPLLQILPGFRRVKVLRTALFWVITQRVAVIPYRRFGAVYWSALQRSKDQNGKRKTGPIEWPETSVRNYLYSLRNNPEEHSSVTWFVTSCVSVCSLPTFQGIVPQSQTPTWLEGQPSDFFSVACRATG